jgi:predicted ribosome quality control (RQC) complex YloA/Tae2 family protein
VISKALEKALKKAEKRVSERLETLNDCKNWRKIYHEGLLLQANLFRLKKGMKEVVVSDWENEGKERIISLDSLISPKAQVAAIFRRGKKLRTGEKHAERLLKASEYELSNFLEQRKALQSVVDQASLARFCLQYEFSTEPKQKALPPKKNPLPAKPYHRFVSQAGLEIWVGKSAKDNDKLTFHFANGLDCWLHAHDYPGSHVVVRCQKGLEPDAETLQDAAELALRYSKAKNSREGEVCLTQVKGLKSVKGYPGKVMVSKPKILRLVLNENRWNRLKSSKK